MSEPENFLGRWSRRKLDPKDEKESTGQENASLPPAETKDAEGLPAGEGEAVAAPEAKPAEPEFDLSKLPSIESITANTDVRMFMLPGVPMALRQAALRKVWVTDPAIRDFIEMAENQWDFTVNSPGFDFSAPAGDIKKMLADILGNHEEEKAPAQAEVKSEAKAEADSVETASTVDSSPDPMQAEQLQAEKSVRLSDPSASRTELEIDSTEEKNISKSEQEAFALQNNDATHTVENTEREIPKRRHGSALPG